MILLANFLLNIGNSKNTLKPNSNQNKNSNLVNLSGGISEGLDKSIMIDGNIKTKFQLFFNEVKNKSQISSIDSNLESISDLEVGVNLIEKPNVLSKNKTNNDIINYKSSNSPVSNKLLTDINELFITNGIKINVSESIIENFSSLNEIENYVLSSIKNDQSLSAIQVELSDGNKISLNKFMKSQFEILRNQKQSLDIEGKNIENMGDVSSGNNFDIIDDYDHNFALEKDSVNPKNFDIYSSNIINEKSDVIISNKSTLNNTSENALLNIKPIDLEFLSEMIDVIDNIENGQIVEIDMEAILNKVGEKIAKAPSMENLIFKTVSKQIARAINNSEKDQNKIKIELSPKGLGEIEISMEKDDDGFVRAVIKAENSQVLEMFRNDKNSFLELMKNGGLDFFNSQLDFQHKEKSESESDSTDSEFTGEDDPEGQIVNNIIETTKIDILT